MASSLDSLSSELDPLNAKRGLITCQNPLSSVFRSVRHRSVAREHTRGDRDEADVDQVSEVCNNETVESSSRKRIASSTNTVRRISGCITPQFFRELR